MAAIKTVGLILVFFSFWHSLEVSEQCPYFKSVVFRITAARDLLREIWFQSINDRVQKKSVETFTTYCSLTYGPVNNKTCKTFFVKEL